MRIIHISDIHITKKGQTIWGVNTLEHFNKALKRISCLGRIDAIIISGDLSDDGSRWSYEYIDKAVGQIGIPTYCCAGNHDNLEELYCDYTPSFYKTCEVFKLQSWTFIMLNSAVPGMSRGQFNYENLLHLLQSNDAPIALVLHHPPIEQDGWLNRKLLENQEDFNALIRQYGNVHLVLYGHTHHYSTKFKNGVVYSSATSIGFAFDPSLPKFEIAHGKEGFSLITFDKIKFGIENILL